MDQGYPDEENVKATRIMTKRVHCRILIAGLGLIFSGCSLSSSSNRDSELTNGAASTDNHSRFPVNAASVHASTTCNDCHGNFDTFLQFSCIDCHEHEQLSTTSKHSGISGFTYDSNACYSCHPDGTSAAINHETFFPISAGTIHAGIDCSTCHLDATKRSVLGCATEVCHPKATTDGDHTAISGYSYDGSSCYGCHPKGTADASSTVNHALIFPIAPGTTHVVASCSNCHVDPANRQVVACVDCHMSDGSTEHSKPETDLQHVNPNILLSVKDYAFLTPDCLDCHPDSNVARVSTHLPFEIQKTSASKPGSTPKHYNRECRKCHNSSQASKPFEATDFNVYSCLPCHNSGHTQSYNNVAATCTQSGCHETGWRP